MMFNINTDDFEGRMYIFLYDFLYESYIFCDDFSSVCVAKVQHFFHTTKCFGRKKRLTSQFKVSIYVLI